MNIDKFKTEHVTVLSAVTDLRKLVQEGVVENAQRIADKLIGMSSAIKLHLAAEDRVLYPAMAKSADAATAAAGKKFQDDMGSIATAYAAFAGKWNHGRALTAEPDKFKQEANDIFKALHQRVQRENTELYPLAEKV